MSASEGASRSDLDALLAQGRNLPPVPELVRARALARARKAVGAPVYLLKAPGTPARRQPRRVLTAAALVFGLSGAAFALTQGWKRQTQSELPTQAAVSASGMVARTGDASSAPATHSAELVAPNMPASPETPPSPAPSAAARPAQAAAQSGSSSAENFGAERELLRRAHRAYSERNFGTTLKLLGEHGRRFPRGLLAEEREALRVRSLASAGQAAEARRAAAAFVERFPRSVLQSRIRGFAAADTEKK